MKQVQQIFPLPGRTVALNGLYLDHQVHRLGTAEKPFVYANFLCSLDGRIALEDQLTGESYLPKTLTNADDFRLFLELHAQADCLITHGGYLRALAAGTLGNILQAGTSAETSDIAEWRSANRITGQPAVVVASASLDFPLPGSLRKHNQTCLIATGKQADPGKVDYWKRKGYEVIFAGNGNSVQGRPLVSELSRRGYRCMYLIAGPLILQTMLRDRQLSRLYQTITHQLLGGEAFHTLLPGPRLDGRGHLQLRTLFHDTMTTNGCSQWFAQFEPLTGE